MLSPAGVVSCHYCDSVGFVEMPDFLTPKPTVAELEDQVKNGQQISLMDLADAIHREKGQKKSVVSQLKNQPRSGRKKSAPNTVRCPLLVFTVSHGFTLNAETRCALL